MFKILSKVENNKSRYNKILFPSILDGDSKFSHMSEIMTSRKELDKEKFDILKNVMRKTKSQLKKNSEQKEESEPAKDKQPLWKKKIVEFGKSLNSIHGASPTFSNEVISANTTRDSSNSGEIEDDKVVSLLNKYLIILEFLEKISGNYATSTYTSTITATKSFESPKKKSFIYLGKWIVDHSH